MRKRDHLDSHRIIDPLRAAADAVMIDTDGLSVEQVLERVMALIDERILSREPSEVKTRSAD